MSDVEGRRLVPGENGAGGPRGLPSGLRLASRPSPSPRVVAVGGGTGLPVVLEGLKRTLFAAVPRGAAEDPDRLTAVVTVSDDGGSSGRLRRAYGVLAPGDIRNCLLVLSEADRLMKRLFGFRFEGRRDVGGHSLGNLILTALSLSEGGLAEAVDRAAEVLAVRGRVLAATRADVSLVAELTGGAEVRGEAAITRAGGRIDRLRLAPDDAALEPRAVAALRAADLVVIGPGSLFTSLIPPLLLRGFSDAVAESGARVVLVMNVMTERGETDGLTAAQHVLALRRHAPRLPLHDVLLDTTPIPDEVRARYAAGGAAPVPADLREIEALGCRPVRRGLLAEGRKIRHDPRALAAALLELAAAGAPRPVEAAPSPGWAAGPRG